MTTGDGDGALKDFAGATDAGDGKEETGVEATGVGKDMLEDCGPL